MKRIAWIFGGVAVAALALLALLVVILPRESLKTGIGEQIAAWTGRDVSLRGDPELSLFPDLTVTLKDVQVGGPAGMSEAEIISMDRLTGKIRILPLVIGRVEIGSYRMVRPLIRLVRDDVGARNWAFDSGAAALQLAFAGDVPLGNFVLEDGTLIYQNRRDGVIERLDSVNLTVDWPSVRQPLMLSGSGIWRGEQVSFSATADTPFEFIKGKSTPLAAKLDSVPLAMTFSGAATDLATPRLNGELSLATPSLRGFAAWLGSPIEPGSTLGPASLSGTAIYRDGELSVDSAELTLDGNNATGALRLTASSRPDVTGTLAFPALDLTPYFAGLATASRSGGWQSVGLATGWFEDFSADIRLSAGSVQLGGIHFRETAASASLRDARLEIGIAEAAFSGGSLSGDLALTHSAATSDVELEAQLRATDFDLALAAPALGLPPSLSGTASVATDLASRGTDLGSLAAGMRGTSTLGVKNGAVPLFGIAELDSGALPTVAAVEPASATPVDDLTARLAFADGTASIEEASIVAPLFSATASGRIGLLDGALALTGTIRPAAAGALIPFAIDGSLSQPLVRPVPPTN